MVSCASAQNLVADPTFANSTTVTATTSYVTDGKWQFKEASPSGSTITFPGNTPFNPNFDGIINAAPLNTGGSQIQLTNGKLYSYSVRIYGLNSFDVYLYAGTTQEVAFVGGGAAGATSSGTFTAPASGTNDLSFEFASNDQFMGLTSVNVQLATPEPRSVIFCAFLLVGICGVERRRFRKIFLKNGKWKMENGKWKMPIGRPFRQAQGGERRRTTQGPESLGGLEALSLSKPASEARRNGKMEDGRRGRRG